MKKILVSFVFSLGLIGNNILPASANETFGNVVNYGPDGKVVQAIQTPPVAILNYFFPNVWIDTGKVASVCIDFRNDTNTTMNTVEFNLSLYNMQNELMESDNFIEHGKFSPGVEIRHKSSRCFTIGDTRYITTSALTSKMTVVNVKYE